MTAHQKPAGRRRQVLGLLTVLWLNMAILPCAMAFQSAEMCVHCPPADEQEMAAHHGHGAKHAEPSRVTIQSECCDLEEASVDSRGSKLDIKPASALVVVTAPAMPELRSQTSGQLLSASDPPHQPGSSPPLHVLFCVYLD
jgi:hypothetical protein